MLVYVLNIFELNHRKGLIQYSKGLRMYITIPFGIRLVSTTIIVEFYLKVPRLRVLNIKFSFGTPLEYLDGILQGPFSKWPPPNMNKT